MFVRNFETEEKSIGREKLQRRIFGTILVQNFKYFINEAYSRISNIYLEIEVKIVHRFKTT